VGPRRSERRPISAPPHSSCCSSWRSRSEWSVPGCSSRWSSSSSGRSVMGPAAEGEGPDLSLAEARSRRLVTLAGHAGAAAAAWAAGERSDRSVVDALAGVATDHADPLCREAAVAALGAIGDDRGLPAILAAQDDRPAVRRRAVIALAPFHGPAVEAALERARQDRDWQVRQAAEDLTDEPTER